MFQLKKFSLFLIFIFLFVQIGCTQNKNVPRVSLSNQNYNFSLNPEYKYKIDPKGKMALGYDKVGKTYQGDELSYQYPYLSTKDRKTVYDIHELESLTEITNVRDKSAGSNIGKGAGYGALIGTGLGGIAFGIIAATNGCNTRSVDTGACSERKGLGYAAASLFGLAAIVLGAATGTIVGAVIPKKRQTIYMP